MPWISFYFYVFLFCSFSLVTLMLMVKSISSFSKKEKIRFYFTYSYLILIFFLEFLVNHLNGNPEIIPLLKIVRFLYYSLTPFFSVLFVRQVERMRNAEITVFSLFCVNILYEFLSMFFGWNFIIDEKGFCQHGPSYIIYDIVLIISLIYIVVSYYFYGKKHKKNTLPHLILILVLAMAGTLIQEFTSAIQCPNVTLSITLVSFLLFIHYCSFSSEQRLEELRKKEMLLKTDAMTGLFNRYQYNLELEKYDDKLALDENLVILVSDINNLKKTNDQFGHEAGDELIVAGATLLKNVFSPFGECYRTGGDEFLVIAHILKGKEKELIRQLDELTSRYRGKRIHGFSMSTGYARSSDYTTVNLEKLINIADQNMYAIKAKYHQTHPSR